MHGETRKSSCHSRDGLFDPVPGPGLFCRLPLHVPGFVAPAVLQGLNVIDNVPGTRAPRSARRWAWILKVRNSFRAAAYRTIRPRESRSQVSHRLRDPDPVRLRAAPGRSSRRIQVPVPIREPVPYRGVPVLAVSDASARMKQIRIVTLV
jgi:hypothetical protein